ncbi:Nickel-dependent lactate racemase [Dethiosulfatibacter aminovorans DSM 17477]|uniref:Nickel-dependent lactate racemase n=1 Tax=Dethiosulfatibacter aminovorans DSM 17477 TaxID=1121476 RepID=A0A1M6F0N3_9FIRM|nr:nickel-dependent lactate racemase [Dethiosulfatibacter aminovorans]SHI91189.1 Nickel-dependent lactate racemase [Dethiosulfatibacter aminovorans DSM 17477]
MSTKIYVPYGKTIQEASIPEGSLLFNGKMGQFPGIENLEEAILEGLNNPIGCLPLKDQIQEDDRILILIEDNTRTTPVDRILPVLVDYLVENGIKEDNMEILTAPGTHRIMTEEEIIEKVGKSIYGRIKISQHDYNDQDSMIDLGTVEAGSLRIPVHINRKVREVDYIIGLGNIIPHSDAGFSGGGKIVQPGICGSATTSATHIAGALMEEIPLGRNEGNGCRAGIEEVARIAGLKFIVNVVKNIEEEVVGIFAGDFVKAHREGSKLSKKVFGVEIPEEAEVVVVSSNPCDIDYWQGEKGLVSAYFSVKKDGYIVFLAPCYEGMEHNHPKLREWSNMTYDDAKKCVKGISFHDREADLVAADIAMANSRVREKANIIIVTDGLTDEEIKVLGYDRAADLQSAIDYVLKENPNASIGLLPRGGDCLPYKLNS